MILKLEDGNEMELRFTHLQVLKRTVVSVLFSHGLHYFTATAQCNSDDNYNKAIGRKVALARAMRGSVPRDIRTQIWEAYWDFVHDSGKKFKS